MPRGPAQCRLRQRRSELRTAPSGGRNQRSKCSESCHRVHMLGRHFPHGSKTWSIQAPVRSERQRTTSSSIELSESGLQKYAAGCTSAPSSSCPPVENSRQTSGLIRRSQRPCRRRCSKQPQRRCRDGLPNEDARLHLLLSIVAFGSVARRATCRFRTQLQSNLPRSLTREWM